jgi:hypothetical protein
MSISIHAGKPADPSMLVNVARLVTAYYTEQSPIRRLSVSACPSARQVIGDRRSKSPSTRLIFWRLRRRFVFIARAAGLADRCF